MPIFEYRCKACGRQFEALVRNEREEVACKACGSKNLDRLLSAFAVKSNSGRTEVPSCPSGTCPMG